VTIYDKVTILGANLAAAKDSYNVFVGGMQAYPEAWSDTEVRFPMPTTDPGVQKVTLEPKPKPVQVVMPQPNWSTTTPTVSDPFEVSPPALLPSLEVGAVTVAKYDLPPSGVEPVPGIVKVRLAPGVTADQVAAEGDDFTQEFPSVTADNLLSRWYVVKVPSGSERDRIMAYAGLDKVEVAEFGAVTKPARAPNDYYYSWGQWGVKKARLTAAWEVRMMGDPIAVLDDGVSAAHEDLSGVVTRLVDYTGTGVLPCDGHGTGVASVAAAHTNNGAGIAGAAWIATVGSYKVLGTGPNCEGTSTWNEQAITQAVADGYRIINMSLGYAACVTSTQNIVNNAWNAGAFLVAAAGNENTSAQTCPAATDHVFGVAASDENDNRASFSNFGGWVDIAAPGQNIWAADITPVPSSSYANWSGTSFSSPLIAGVASMLHADGLTNSQIEQRLRNNADGTSWGIGRLNAYRALRPQQGCIRDIPIGAWVSAGGVVWQVAGPNLLRGLPDPSAVASWKAWPDVVTLCDDRFHQMAQGSSTWGYRPGTLVSAPGYGVYLITTDGDRGLPAKRHITSPDVFNCFGWQWSNILTGAPPVIDSHPEGPPIDSCSTLPGVLPRSFPNGTIIRSPGGTIYVMEAGLRRGIPDIEIYNSWFGSTEWVQATQAEMDLTQEGSIWGFRQGRIIQPSGSSGIYFITDDGAQRAQGSRRGFMDPTTINERGYASVTIIGNVAANVAAIHPQTMVLDNADNMP
jgi:thermitase